MESLDNGLDVTDRNMEDGKIPSGGASSQAMTIDRRPQQTAMKNWTRQLCFIGLVALSGLLSIYGTKVPFGDGLKWNVVDSNAVVMMVPAIATGGLIAGFVRSTKRAILIAASVMAAELGFLCIDTAYIRHFSADAGVVAEILSRVITAVTIHWILVLALTAGMSSFACGSQNNSTNGNSSERTNVR